MLFDTGPEEDVWERNVTRLRPDILSIELIHLSHWHRDHSGAKAHSLPPFRVQSPIDRRRF